MEIKKGNIPEGEFYKLIELVFNICEKYNVPIVDNLLVDGRLKSSNGIYSIITSDSSDSTIKLSKKIYSLYGYEETEKTLRHELAHHICWFKYNTLDHGENFLKICIELKGALNEQLAEKCNHKELCTDNFSPIIYKWKYTCPNCNVEIKRQRKPSKKTILNYYCKHCGTPVTKWIEEKLC